jgi:UDP-N-acetylglucosamine--N-acetylmuramyl-(pentapeptide) pyrophosphoryl-undecaprenol N-acetylglucosamine transferase
MVTGGGTGGHTSPAVAIIEELQKRDARLQIQWVGRRGSVEEDVSKALAIPFRSLIVEGWPRNNNRVRKASAGIKLVVGMAQAGWRLIKFHPQLVLGVGGYVSLPLMWVAQRMGIPTAIHEQNKRLGMANRILAKRADLLLLSFQDTLGDYDARKACVVGNPTRAAFVHPPSMATARQTLGLEPNKPVVLVVGGSQGARSLNRAVEGMIANLPADAFQIIWMTGKADAAAARAAAEKAAARVDVFAFVQDMATAYAAADIVVCRAGASTTSEIALMSKPSILVPFPFATDRHQDANASAFADARAGIVIDDDALTPQRLQQTLQELFNDPRRLEDMARAARGLAKPAAVELIVEKLFALVFEQPVNA